LVDLLLTFITVWICLACQGDSDSLRYCIPVSRVEALP
jgi:hypothetical protein